MVKIHLNQQQLPAGIIPAQELASASAFSLGLIAHGLSVVDTVNELVGKNSYQDKIDILEHQTKTALHVLNNFSHRALLADEVGLGKTIEAGIILKELIIRKLVKKVLVLTPATLKFQWQEEMRSKFTEHFEIADTPQTYLDEDRVISSIDTAKTQRHLSILKDVHWDLVVVDEAHKLKNSATLNYKLVKALQKDRCLMLTATPLQNNIFELWALLDLLHPGLLETKAKFTEHFVADKEGLKIKNREILHEKLGRVMIRNLRKDTGIKFAARIVQTHFLEFSREEYGFYTDVISFLKKRYEEIKKQEKEKEEQDSDVEDLSNMTEAQLKMMAAKYRQKGLLTFALIMLTRQLTSSIKTGIAALERYKDTLEDQKEILQVDALLKKGELIGHDTKMEHLVKLLKKQPGKAIVFTTFIHTQKMIDIELKLQGFKTVLFNGIMTPEEKEEAIKAFKGEKQILVCTDAGSEGRNLQFANILINYDLPWNPMRIEQRIGRVHRIGQKSDVYIHNIAVKDTIEAYILNRLYEKINLFQVTIGEMDMILTELKSKGGVEKTIFSAAMEDDYSFGDDLSQAKEKTESIKSLDDNVFGKVR
jgi:SNF2 family DNA or RNA helicase